MSAYIVNKAHIDALVLLGQRGPSDRAPQYPGDGWYGPYTYRDKTLDEIGTDLVCENVRSINARYPDTIDDPEHMPGPIEHYWEPTYTFNPKVKHPTTIEGLKLIACYEYQACEHAGWATSDAHDYCQSLRSALVSELPGYDAAPWGWPE
jgi:hypothetical protein